MATNRINTIEKRTAPSYIEGSPLILEAYALHEDTATGRRIAQLKWRNICQQPVRAVMAELVCYDSFKHQLESKVFTYDQLNVSPNGLFGDNQAILLPDNGTMHCEVLLKAVTYENAEVWENPSAVPFEPLPEAVPLAMEDETLLPQYVRDVKTAYGFNTAKYEPAQNKGLWQCTCGSWQPEGNTCLVCGATPEALQELRNEDNLRQNLAVYEEAQERLRKEKEEAKRKREEELKRKQEQQRKEEEERRERRARIAQIMAEEEARRKKRTIIKLIVFAIIAVVVVGFLLADKFYFRQKAQYDLAIEIGKKGDYAQAMVLLHKISGYKDVNDQIAALRAVFPGSVSAGEDHTVGLKSDGTVVAVGWNEYGQCDVSGWTDIVQISAGSYHTVGLKSDGTVVAVGLNEEDDEYIDYCGQCDVSGWTDIIQIFAGRYHTVGLKSDGTVVAVGLNDDGRCDVGDWCLKVN